MSTISRVAIINNRLDTDAMLKVLTFLMEVVGVPVTAFKLDLFTPLNIYSNREPNKKDWGLSWGLFTPVKFCEKNGLTLPIQLRKDHVSQSPNNTNRSNNPAIPSIPAYSNSISTSALASSSAYSGVGRTLGNGSAKRLNSEPLDGSPAKSIKYGMESGIATDIESDEKQLQRAIEESLREPVKSVETSEDIEMKRVLELSMKESVDGVIDLTGD
jgi:hypothetical protein